MLGDDSINDDGIGKKKLTCELCKQRKVKCNGETPCNSCLQYKKLKDKTQCVYNTGPPAKRKRRAKEPSAEGMLAYEKISAPKSIQLAKPEPLEALVQTLEEYEYLPDRSYGTNIETHLLSLSFCANAGFTVEDSMQAVIPVQRRHKLSSSLKKALCFHSVFISSSKQLFSSSNPSFQERLEVARSYEVDHNILKSPSHYSSIRDFFDDFRALLIQCAAFANLGDEGQGRQLLNNTVHLGRTYGFFQSNFAEMFTDHQRYGFSYEQEQYEKLSLWIHLLKLDTQFARVTGYDYLFQEFPEVQPTQSSPFYQAPTTRLCHPDLAANTIWQESFWAPIFDDFKESAYIMAFLSRNAEYRVHSELMQIISHRKIIDFSRTKLVDPLQSGDDYVRLHHHNYLLDSFTLISSKFALINSLKPFAFSSSGTIVQAHHGIRNHEIFANTFTVLAMFSHIHLSGAQTNDPKLYPLEVNGAEEYSPKDVFLAALNAISYLIDVANGPSKPTDSISGPYNYHPQQLSNCINNTIAPNVPSPYLCSLGIAFDIYYITSCCLIALQTSYEVSNPEMVHCISVVQTKIIPALGGIARVWPDANQYINELMRLLTSVSHLQFF
ncbi:hypothetical protein HDV04_003740 [Boothiomyces sp. JEL0838]|nr:hypothetical protein HDV04_003740 [Boothiomyces sp. JEL0838]